MLRFFLQQAALAILIGTGFLGSLFLADAWRIATLILNSPDRMFIGLIAWLGAMGPFIACYIATGLALRVWDR